MKHPINDQKRRDELEQREAQIKLEQDTTILLSKSPWTYKYNEID
jgi:hypothetical protein